MKNMLTGEYHHNLDDKNRLIIPSKLRLGFSENIIVTRGLDGCLFAYDNMTWNKIMEKLTSLPFTKVDARNFTRFFTSGAITLEFDKQARIIIPSYLLEYANISKKVVLVGVCNRLEIWSEDKWNEFLQLNIDSLSDISENLFDSNLEL